MSDNSVEPTAISIPSASAPLQPSANVEPSTIPNTPSAPLSSVVQETFKPAPGHMVVDGNLESRVQGTSEPTDLKK